jgi:CubicO group peptidase (beta-lactamase class C family)
VHLRGYGMADLEQRIPNAPEMVYNVGSVSKQFTAAAVGLLTLQGRISLDDDVREYVPELRDRGVRITIRHLLHHTNGLETLDELLEDQGMIDQLGTPLHDAQHVTDSAAVALIAQQQALRFEPGSEHEYGNSGYFLLGQIVERVSGQSLRAYAEEHIFAPLGMTQTHFHDEAGHVIENLSMATSGVTRAIA